MSDTAKLGAETLRIGVVGVGVMGSNHARVLSELPGVKLIGVADPDRKRRETVARNLGCAAFDDTDALLDEGVDAVTIAAAYAFASRYRHRLRRARHPRHG